jgi:hypothetical protein
VAVLAAAVVQMVAVVRTVAVDLTLAAPVAAEAAVNKMDAPASVPIRRGRIKRPDFTTRSSTRC